MDPREGRLALGPVETPLELVRVEPLEEAAEGVVGSDTMGQVQKRLQPVVLDLSEVLDVVPGVSPGNDGADGAGHDIEEFVVPGAVDAWVGQVGEMMGDGAFLVGRHGVPPWSLRVEEENYQNYGATTSFRQLISNAS
jgi:hypothetical protein